MIQFETGNQKKFTHCHITWGRYEGSFTGLLIYVLHKGGFIGRRVVLYNCRRPPTPSPAPSTPLLQNFCNFEVSLHAFAETFNCNAVKLL